MKRNLKMTKRKLTLTRARIKSVLEDHGFQCVFCGDDVNHLDIKIYSADGYDKVEIFYFVRTGQIDMVTVHPDHPTRDQSYVMIDSSRHSGTTLKQLRSNDEALDLASAFESRVQAGREAMEKVQAFYRKVAEALHSI